MPVIVTVSVTLLTPSKKNISRVARGRSHARTPARTHARLDAYALFVDYPRPVFGHSSTITATYERFLCGYRVDYPSQVLVIVTVCFWPMWLVVD